MLVLLVRFVTLLGQVYAYLLIASAVLSWFPALAQSRLAEWIDFLVNPVLRPLRRLGLQFGGLDFTVYAALILIELLQKFVSTLVF